MGIIAPKARQENTNPSLTSTHKSLSNWCLWANILSNSKKQVIFTAILDTLLISLHYIDLLLPVLFRKDMMVAGFVRAQQCRFESLRAPLFILLEL